MMKKNSTFFLAFPILVILLAACTEAKAEKMGETSKEVENASDDSDKAHKRYAREIAVYRESAESDLRESKLKIAKLQDQRTAVKEEVSVSRNEKIAAIRKSTDELELRLRQYRGDNMENWEEFKREFDSDMLLLGNSLRDLGKDNTE